MMRDFLESIGAMEDKIIKSEIEYLLEKTRTY